MLRRRLFAYTCAMIAGISSGYFILENTRPLAGLLLMISIGTAVCFAVPTDARPAARGDESSDDRGGDKARWHITDRVRLTIWLLIGFVVFARAYISFESPLELPGGRVIHAGDAAALGAVTEVSGRVLSVTAKDDGYRMVICDTGIRGVRRIQIIYNGELDEDSFGGGMLVGCRITAYGKLREFRRRENPACFDYDLYMRSQGIRYRFRADSLEAEAIATGAFWRYRHFIQRERESFLELFSDDEIRGFVRGMVFGDKSEIDEDTIDAFNRNSTGHILAVSGLHVGFLYALLRLLSGRRRTRGMAILTIALIILYGEMTLWSASTIRAVTVLSIDLMAMHLRRRADMLTSVSAAAMMILFVQPYQLFSTGFQMTFLALASICFLKEPLAMYVGEGLAVMFAVQAGIAPLTAYAFNRFNPLAVLINVPVLMAASVLIPACIMMMFVHMLTGMLPGFAISLTGAAVSGLVGLNEWLSFDGGFSFLASGSMSDAASDMLPGAAAALNGSSTALIILWYLIIFLMSSEWMRVLLIRKDWQTVRRMFLCMLLPAVMLAAASYNDFADDEIVFVSVGQGDCTHIRCGSRDVLIDGGGSTFYNVGEGTLMPYLLKNGASDIDLACVTHLHTDHFLGITELAEEYPVKRTGIPSEYRSAIEKERISSGRRSRTDEEEAAEGIGSIADIENIMYVEPGSRIGLDEGVYIEPVWPVSGMRRSVSLDDPNENNTVYMVHYRGIRIMVTGDLTEEDELAMIAHYRAQAGEVLKCDILKVAHHGSKSSSSEAFLDAASPSIAVISVGKDNMYGHPHQQTLDRLQARGIRVYRTDIDGAIGIDIHRNRLMVDTVR